MLSLTRRIHEEILVIDRQTGEQIVVAPIAFRGNQVKIGIEASDRFQILRRELQGRERSQPSGPVELSSSGANSL